MSDITESGKGWIPVREANKHFKNGDLVFVYSKDANLRALEFFCPWPVRERYQDTCLKLATVEWPEFPYTAEGTETRGKE